MFYLLQRFCIFLWLLFVYFDGHLCVEFSVHTLDDHSKAPLPEKGLHLIPEAQQTSLIDGDALCRV